MLGFLLFGAPPKTPSLLFIYLCPVKISSLWAKEKFNKLKCCEKNYFVGARNIFLSDMKGGKMNAKAAIFFFLMHVIIKKKGYIYYSIS